MTVPRSVNGILNVFSCDVEDWYQTNIDFSARISERCYDSVSRCIDILDEADVKGTFFVQGLVAKQWPAVVKLIDRRGHDMGTHGYSHKPIYSMSPSQFDEEIRVSCQLLEDLTGKVTRAFRAPYFSVSNEMTWALDILAQRGIQIDSSVFPMRVRRYGNPGRSLAPHKCGPEDSIWEVPVSILQIGRFKVPVAGGGYMRLLPLSFLRWSVQQINAQGRPFVLYCHTYEFDPDDWHRMGNSVPFSTRFHQNVGRMGFPAKIRSLLRLGAYGPASKAVAQIEGRLTSISGSLRPTSVSSNAVREAFNKPQIIGNNNSALSVQPKVPAAWPRSTESGPQVGGVPQSHPRDLRPRQEQLGVHGHNNGLIFRPWTDQDKPKILHLMRLEYGGRSQAHADYFDWQYRQNPTGPATICCCEAHDGTIAGIYATIPVPVRFMGKSRMGSLSLNSLTHPGYRKRGIFTNGAQEVFARLKENDVAFTLGFPNDNSYRGFVTKLSFADVGEATVLIRPHDFAGLMSTKLPFMQGPTVRRLCGLMQQAIQPRPREAHPVQEIRTFRHVALEKLKEEKGLTIDTDADWLEWRYLKTPHRVHFAALVGSEEDPLGLCIFSHDQRLGVKIGLVMELMLAEDADENVVSSLMARVFDRCAKAQCLATFALVAPNSRKAAFMQKSGFWKAPSSMQPHAYRIIYRQHIGQPVGLTVGDIDVSFGMNDT